MAHLKNYASRFQVLLVLSFLAFSSAAFAQNFTVSGRVKDATNGEDIIGAIVSIKEIPTKGTSTNSYGFYSLTLPEGDYSLIYQYIGYAPLEKRVSLRANQTLNVELGATENTLGEAPKTPLAK